MFYYAYVLLSKKDNKLYVGYTDNIKRRILEHNRGNVNSTKNRRPLEIIYFEGCKNKLIAI
jgi:putative endonuclease